MQAGDLLALESRRAGSDGRLSRRTTGGWWPAILTSRTQLREAAGGKVNSTALNAEVLFGAVQNSQVSSHLANVPDIHLSLLRKTWIGLTTVTDAEKVVRLPN